MASCSTIVQRGTVFDRRLVEDCIVAMYGRIEVESVEGVGTTFVVTLARTPPEAATLYPRFQGGTSA
jgi:signal transduction histidine kinase